MSRLVTSVPHVLPALSGSGIRDMTEESAATDPGGFWRVPRRRRGSGRSEMATTLMRNTAPKNP
ncbi:hypothetical protein GALLR39Z86_42850 [Glycomyces algeriensis]|uniref:Uncharacterized protein n=1 Tax=Glycomyces algeriensis TaxID=256037 RepID=A0A9W6GAK6_9ACTN|nr:hypothetical protein GALLR39Z86_42850 [Glycomyces algeriensis]